MSEECIRANGPVSLREFDSTNELVAEVASGAINCILSDAAKVSGFAVFAPSVDQHILLPYLQNSDHDLVDDGTGTNAHRTGFMYTPRFVTDMEATLLSSYDEGDISWVSRVHSTCVPDFWLEMLLSKNPSTVGDWYIEGISGRVGSKKSNLYAEWFTSHDIATRNNKRASNHCVFVRCKNNPEFHCIINVDAMFLYKNVH